LSWQQEAEFLRYGLFRRFNSFGAADNIFNSMKELGKIDMIKENDYGYDILH